MKKAVLIVSALLLIVSGVAAVSAFEAHVVNVKAHVENALIVSRDADMDFGITFPQDLLEKELYIGLSESFRSTNQTRVSDLEYVLFWTPKLVSEHPGAIDPDGDGFFEPIYPFIVPGFVSAESPLDGIVPGAITPPSSFTSCPTPSGYVKWGWGHLDKASDPSDVWHLKFNVPVFDAWWNNGTDPNVNYPHILYSTPGDGDITNEDYIVVSENFTYTYPDGTQVLVEGDVPHADLGNNLKIQVVAYSYD